MPGIAREYRVPWVFSDDFQTFCHSWPQTDARQHHNVAVRTARQTRQGRDFKPMVKKACWRSDRLRAASDQHTKNADLYTPHVLRVMICAAKCMNFQHLGAASSTLKRLKRLLRF